MDRKESFQQEDQTDAIEQIDESGAITEPFDPNLIKIETHQLTLHHIIDRLKHNEINLFTEFQRRKDLWTPTQQSRLIESVLLRMPIPSFYFDGQEDNKWQIVDGLQRVSTIKNFAVDKTLILEDLEFLKRIEDCGYDNLHRDLQRRIDSFPIVVYLVQKDTPEEVKFNLFRRINTGGLLLTPQEIRHALNQGIPADYIKELAESEEFKKATCYSIRSDRMEDRDFVTRFVSFYLDVYDYQPDLDSFMNKGMAKIKKISEAEREKMKKDFIRAMNVSVEIFGDDAFRKRFDPNDRRRKPINKAFFETLSVIFAFSPEAKTQELIRLKEIFKEKLIGLMNDNKFIASISSGTGKKGSVETRFENVARIILETLGE